MHRPKVTLRQLTEAFLEQHEAAPSTLVFIRDNMRPALEIFGDDPIGALKVHQIGAWRRRCRRASGIGRTVRCGRCFRRRSGGSGSRTTRRRW
jgi:hypothetical protein